MYVCTYSFIYYITYPYNVEKPAAPNDNSDTFKAVLPNVLYFIFFTIDSSWKPGTNVFGKSIAVHPKKGSVSSK